MTSETCKGAPNPERGDGAEIKGQGTPETTGPVVEGPYKGKNRRDGRKPTQCTGSGPRREDRRKKHRSIANRDRTNVNLPQIDERNVIITQENQSGLKLKSHKHSSVDMQSDTTPLSNRTIERREPPTSPQRGQHVNIGRHSRRPERHQTTRIVARTKTTKHREGVEKRTKVVKATESKQERQKYDQQRRERR